VAEVPAAWSFLLAPAPRRATGRARVRVRRASPTLHGRRPRRPIRPTPRAARVPVPPQPAVRRQPAGEPRVARTPLGGGVGFNVLANLAWSIDQRILIARSKMAARATRARAPLHGRRPEAPVPEGVPQVAPPPPKAAPRPAPSAVQKPKAQTFPSALPGVQPAQAPLPRPAPSVARRPAPAPAPRVLPQSFPGLSRIFAQLPTGLFARPSGPRGISRLRIADFPGQISQSFPLTGVKPGAVVSPQAQPQPEPQTQKCRCPKPKKAKPRTVCRFGYYSETPKRITFKPWGKKSCQPSKSRRASSPSRAPISFGTLPTRLLGLVGL